MSRSDSILEENANIPDVQQPATVLCTSNKRFRRDTSCSDDTNVQSPSIHQIPTELLLEIFLWGVTLEAVSSGGYSVEIEPLCYTFKFPHHALDLSGVCRLWRNITTSCPRLWSCDEWSIEMSRIGSYGIRSIARYLEMSKPLPLTLQLYSLRDPNPKLVRLVLSHRARFRTLLIHDGLELIKSMEKELEYLGPRPVTGYFPNLESFEHECHGYEGIEAGQFIHKTDIFSVTPRLRSLVINGFDGGLPFPFFRLESPFPYSQLESFTLGLSQLADWELLRSACPRLRNLTLRHGLVCHIYPTPPLPPPVVFPSLTYVRFDVNDFHVDALAEVFKIIVLPSLQSLCLYSLAGDTLDDLEDFKEFLSRLSCPLKELCFDWVEIPVDDLHEILGLVPQLTQLTIRFPLDEDATIPSSNYSRLIKLLTIDGDDTRIPILPCLEHLELNMMMDRDMMLRLTAMLDTNWPGTLSLTTKGTKELPLFIPRRLNHKFSLDLPKHVVGDFSKTFINVKG